MFQFYFKEKNTKWAGLALNLYIDKNLAKLVHDTVF